MEHLSLGGKSVMVTGGAGFIGSHLVDRLITEDPSRIMVVDNLFLGRERNLAHARQHFPGLQLYTADVGNFRAMKKILEKERVDVVFNLATIPLPASLTRPQWTIRRILNIAAVICELCRQGAFQTLVHCSSSEAYGSAQSIPMDERHPLEVKTPYSAAKAASDLIVRSYWETFGIDSTIVRPFNTYGPRQNDRTYAGVIPRVMRRVLKNKRPLIYGDGEQTRDFIYVTDTADGILRAYQRPLSRRRIINIASGQEVSINRLVDKICRLVGFQKPPIHRPARPADVHRHLADVTLAQDVLGFTRHVPLDEGLYQTVEWYRTSDSVSEGDGGV